MNVHCSTAFDRVADASGIEILDHGLAELDGEWNHRHIRPSYSRLYYILNGGGFVETERETVSLVSGKTYLIPAGLTLHYGCPGRMTQLYFHVSRARAGRVRPVRKVGSNSGMRRKHRRSGGRLRVRTGASGDADALSGGGGRRSICDSGGAGANAGGESIGVSEGGVRGGFGLSERVAYDRGGCAANEYVGKCADKAVQARIRFAARTIYR